MSPSGKIVVFVVLTLNFLVLQIAERAKGLTPADLAEVYEDAISDKIDHVTTSFRQINDIYFRKRGPYYVSAPP